ncbi:MAG TPA: hypothetical protein VG166_07575 [Caulobacteraceae bacterium]|nr:hypothetical protein [Caulobacteraceae bacterium]
MTQDQPGPGQNDDFWGTGEGTSWSSEQRTASSEDVLAARERRRAARLAAIAEDNEDAAPPESSVGAAGEAARALPRQPHPEDRVFPPSIDSRTRSWLMPGRTGPTDPDTTEPAQARTTTEDAFGFKLGVAPPSALRALPSLPGGTYQTSLAPQLWFIASLIVPTLLGIIYYGLIAANQYVCEFRFTVQDPATSPAMAEAAAATSALSTMFGPAGSAATPDQLNSFVATDYDRSAQAAADLDQRLDLRKIYSRGNSDWLARLASHSTNEQLASYYKRMSYSLSDPATGLTVARVRAFTPQDAYAIAQTLYGLTALTVNSAGQSSRVDSVNFAKSEVDRLHKVEADLDARMTTLRNRNGVIDPTTGAVAGNITLATTLRANIAQIQTQIGSLTQQLHNPNAPQIQPLKSQLAAARSQLGSVEAEVNGGRNKALTTVVGQFESLTLQRQTTEQALTAAIANLQQAIAQRNSERIYLAPYVRPLMPTSSTYPERLKGMIIVFMASLLVWVTGLLLANALLEHS